MKLFVCVFLVLVVLEEYHCDPCWTCKERKDNETGLKFSLGLGFSAKLNVTGGSEYTHENGHSPMYHLYHRHPPHDRNWLRDRSMYTPDKPRHQLYRINGLGHKPSYIPYYEPSYVTSRHPYSSYNDRPFGRTHNIPYIPYGRQGESNYPLQRIPYHRGVYGPQNGRPPYGPLHPTLFSTAHQTPNSSPYDAPSSSPKTAQTPVESGDSTSQKKQYFVTPTGIQETPAQPDDKAS